MATDTPSAPARPFTILAVCTANLCRSPAVERLFAAAFGPESGIVVESAGLDAVVGAPMPERMAALVRKAAVSPEGFTSKQLTEQLLLEADLVLAMTRAQRARIVSLVPSAVRRTFTLRELARLAHGVDRAALPTGTEAARLAALLLLTPAQRGLAPVEPGDDDVVDPYGGGDALHARAFGELWPAVAEIVRVVRR